MKKNITFSADEGQIERAREKARRENRTLNEAFRDWLGAYSGRENPLTLAEIRKRWSHIKVGGPYTRDEMNER